MRVMRSLFQFATDDLTSLVGLDCGFMRGLANLARRGVCVPAPFCLGLARVASIYSQEEAC